VSPLLALFPLDLVLFPTTPLPLHIFEPRYKELIGDCLESKMPFGVVKAKEDALAEVGCTAHITQVVKRYEDGRLDIVTEGVRRFEIVELNHDRSFVQAEVLFFEDTPNSPPSKGQREKALELHDALIDITGSEAAIVSKDKSRHDDVLSFQLAHELPVDLDFKQALLAMRSEAERLKTLIEYYENILPKLRRVVRTREKASTNGHAM
jgi:Lon protease-like protein